MKPSPLFIPGSAGETFGRVLRTRRAGRFLFRESFYPPSVTLPPHFHPLPYFSFVVAGSMRERRAGDVHVDGAGSLHFHPAREPHSGAAGERGARCLSVILVGEPLERSVRARRPACRADWRGAARIARRCLGELSLPDSATDLSLETLALELFDLALAERDIREPVTPRWLLRVRDHLHEHFLEPVPLSDLSSLAGIHEVHLVRAFRRRFSATPGAYLRALRIEHARRALVESDDPIAEIALASGFSSQAHLTHRFHRALGATPAAYRSAHRRASA